jgi:hypothetical protein
MGYWYEPGEVSALANKYGLDVQFVPSNLYPYRFHAVLRKASAIDEEQAEKTQARVNVRSLERMERSA